MIYHKISYEKKEREGGRERGRKGKRLSVAEKPGHERVFGCSIYGVTHSTTDAARRRAKNIRMLLYHNRREVKKGKPQIGELESSNQEGKKTNVQRRPKHPP